MLILSLQVFTVHIGRIGARGPKQGKTCPSYRLNCCLGRVLSSVLRGSSFIDRFFGKAEVKNGVLKSGPSFLRRRRRGMM
ncbi:23.6 kDa heat shock, mitochondrial-like protein [Gossypium australe]|uniref:23.6 kDa heat shock, mitochondrial-like protein n=1 Tax=Gossypium australe TaxID=47621 RepID=A0A5B6X9W1_9ROSI|nr:23.6 kDa heat shock, mitochondrial-like protein [Gossypium australe]